ncbi:uncharacterized protein LOC131936835 [Physella acuta]|uniref:uncharacterized protein LOC131936835 n=1 Tax=Physella acuta TaxID=109671 RepID=UPI0027DD215E|nr:uncharacterized protein LOC131936835 [Physella acuta]
MKQLAMLLLTHLVVMMLVHYTGSFLLEKSPSQKHNLEEPFPYFREEGRDFVMECTSDDINDTHVWTIATPNGKKIFDRCCGADTCDRHRHLDSSVKVMCYVNGTKTHSRLRIGKITQAHRDNSIQCRALKNGNPSSTIQVRSARLMTFHKPRNPLCQVLPTGENSHRVTCTAPGGYPEMTCNMTQYEEDQQRKTIIDRHFNYSYVKSDKHPDLLTTVCSIDLPYLTPGNYTYFTVFAPNLTTYVRNASTPAPPTQTV